MTRRSLPDTATYRRMTSGELRAAFVLDGLFVPDRISMVYCDADRAIVGGAMPLASKLTLQASKKEMAAAYFTERRELGIVNIGGRGTVTAGETEYALAPKDMLYVGRGVKHVGFSSATKEKPAVFYFVSFPAHTAHPVSRIRFRDAAASSLGKARTANRRTIRKYIHAGGAQSCQLVMGLTDLETGSVWNTMPPHTHARRTEVYLYFGLDPDSMVMHLMGPPDEMRSVVVRNREAVISPDWSVHSGAGTASYTFVWAMGGENQDFADMDAIPMNTLR